MLVWFSILMSKTGLGVVMAILTLSLLFPQGATFAASSASKKCSTEQKALDKLEKKSDSIEKKYDRKIEKIESSKQKDGKEGKIRALEIEKTSKLANIAVEQIAAQSKFNTCKGLHIPSPGSLSPSAICHDGTYSYSITRSGTCSWHGGVWKWY